MKMWNLDDMNIIKQYDKEKNLEQVTREMLHGVYKNKKTGDDYVVLGVVYDTTNRNEGNFLVIYVKKGKLSDIKMIFARELLEFCEKFERVGTVNINLS